MSERKVNVLRRKTGYVNATSLHYLDSTALRSTVMLDKLLSFAEYLHNTMATESAARSKH